MSEDIKLKNKLKKSVKYENVASQPYIWLLTEWVTLHGTLWKKNKFVGYFLVKILKK